MKSFRIGNPCGIENVRHDVSRCDEVYIMAANVLEFEHHLCQFFILAFLASSLMGDRPVLAEDTAEVTIREEDGAGSILAYQR
jgi:hypothetical protein